MPDLDDIHAFTEVADSGSLTRAGVRLGMSKSMVSRRLARLESELGAALLSRTTRGMSLTEAGDDFRPFAERMVADLRAGRDAVSRQGEPSGRLRIAAPVSFGNSHLAPVLAQLAIDHPALEINVSFSDRFVDLVGEGFDAAIRLGTLRDSTLIARRVSAVRAVLVASPAYLARAGTPRTPADLARHDAVPHFDQVWRFRRGGRVYSHRPHGRFIADSGVADLTAVAAGLGVAVMPTFLAGSAIERGELVVLMPDYAIPEAGMYIVRPPPAEPVPNKIKVLTEAMLRNFGADDWDRCAPGPAAG